MSGCAGAPFGLADRKHAHWERQVHSNHVLHEERTLPRLKKSCVPSFSWPFSSWRVHLYVERSGRFQHGAVASSGGLVTMFTEWRDQLLAAQPDLAPPAPTALLSRSNEVTRARQVHATLGLLSKAGLVSTDELRRTVHSPQILNPPPRTPNPTQPALRCGKRGAPISISALCVVVLVKK